MTAWRCSFVAPKSEHVESTVEADTVEEAALSYHDEHDETGFRYRHETAEDGVVYIRFALVKVKAIDDTAHEFVTRIFHHGLWRKGGVKRPGVIDTLEGIARELGYTHDPKSLVASGWDLEESMPQAEERRASRYRT